MKPTQARAQEKELRLIDAASRVIHKQGFVRTTLSDIAQEAEIALGSLYYYFKTKDDIVRAIVAQRVRDLREGMIDWERLDRAADRIDALIQVWVNTRDVDALYGCPIGSLCYELAKQGGALGALAAEPLRLQLDWAKQQFCDMGYDENAAGDLALHLITALQGISLLSNAFSDAELITREARHLRLWLQQL